MTVNLVELLSKQVPELVNAATAEMKANADKGDAELAQRYQDLLANAGAIRVKLEGKGGADLYLVSDKGSFRTDTSAPSGMPIWLAVGVNVEEANVGLEELEDEIEQGLKFLRKRLTRQNPKKMRGALEKLSKEALKFHVVIKDTPDFDEIRIKIGLGASEPPEKGNFNVSIGYDTLEAVKERKIRPQALLGKLQLSGDSSRFMALMMELAQRG